MLRIIVLIVLAQVSILSLPAIDNVFFNAVRANDYLNIPSYVIGNDEVVHPDVVYIPNGWNGYKYWMVFTPFPNSAPQYENPSIVVSQDGIIWSVPSGLTNPVVLPYDDIYDPNNFYHSDPDLILSPDQNTMYLCWRNHAGWNEEKFGVISSTDGINWTNPIYPFSTLSTNGERILSPSIIYNGSEYELYTVNSKTSPRTYFRRTASIPTGTWGNKTEVDFLINDGSSWINTDDYTGNLQYASQIWHFNILYENNEYWVIASVGGATQTRGGQLWIGKSLDGLNWNYDSNPLLDYAESGWDRLIYRTAALPYYTDGSMNLRLWYSSDGGTATDNMEWHIGYTEAIAILTDSAVEFNYLSAVINNWNNSATLKWHTETEYDTSHFNVFRANRASLYYAIKRNTIPINAKNTPSDYTFEDELVNSDTLFYWIESVSIGGDSKFSNMIVAIRDDSIDEDDNIQYPTELYNKLIVYPNPFNPATTISFVLTASESAYIELFDLKGRRILKTESQQYKSGMNRIELDLDRYSRSSGVYYCRLVKESGTLTSKLVLLK